MLDLFLIKIPFKYRIKKTGYKKTKFVLKFCWLREFRKKNEVLATFDERDTYPKINTRHKHIDHRCWCTSRTSHAAQFQHNWKENMRREIEHFFVKIENFDSEVEMLTRNRFLLTKIEIMVKMKILGKNRNLFKLQNFG